MSEVGTEELDRLIGGAHHDPHAVLGAHPAADGVMVRALRPMADAVSVVLADGSRYPLEHEHDGIFRGALPLAEAPDYRLAVSYPGCGEHLCDDPYRHLPTLGELDLHLVGEGRHERLWRVLGAHVRTFEGPAGEVTGTAFAVWAPNARGIRMVGDFNHWDGRGHPMRSLGSSGVWELFVPDVGDGDRYKYAVLGADGSWRDKADPMAMAAEKPPATASVVYTSRYTWGDGDWIAARAAGARHAEPVSTYEVHLGSWRPSLDYRELAEQLVAYVTDLHFTHVELLPVAEHP